jgi:two-component system chemotaxis response regulator CheY
MAYNMLIVDDSLPMRSVIKKTIKASGYGTTVFFDAAHGIEALKILQDEWMDIVVTDYNMPEMNGIELIREMKKNELMASMPVLVITTEGSQKMIREFMDSGASGYIKKPFTPEAIREKLTEILGEPDHEEDLDDSDEEFDF